MPDPGKRAASVPSLTIAVFAVLGYSFATALILDLVHWLAFLGGDLWPAILLLPVVIVLVRKGYSLSHVLICSAVGIIAACAASGLALSTQLSRPYIALVWPSIVGSALYGTLGVAVVVAVVFLIAKRNAAKMPATTGRSSSLRSWIIPVAVVLALFLLFWLHPYILGLPGRLQEHVFETSLKRGMARSDVIQLAQRLHSRSMFDDSWPPTKPWAGETNPRSLDIIFDDIATFCVVSGRWYHLRFEARSHRLQSWKAQGWGSAC